MAGDTNKKKLVGRHKRVAFMDVAGDGKTFTRMPFNGYGCDHAY